MGLKDPFGEAGARGADVVQLHLSPPRNWRDPVPSARLDELRAWRTPLYVHAPYLVNPASADPVVRERSAASLAAQLAAATAAGARGVVVHAGHPTGGGSLDDALAGWREVLAGLQSSVPLLVENTAGGTAGPGRSLAGLTALWPVVAGAEGVEVGVCLDTCHAWAAGLDLTTLVDDVVGITGRLDLLHVNDSRDAPGSGRDRHANLGAGLIPEHLLVGVAAAAARLGVPMLVETPGDNDGQAADVQWLRARLR